MSWLEKELHTIAVNLNKKPAQFEPLIKKFLDEMIESEEDFML